MALEDIVFQEANGYGESNFIVEIDQTHSGVLEDILFGNNSYDDTLTTELKYVVNVIVDNRRKVR